MLPSIFQYPVLFFFRTHIPINLCFPTFQVYSDKDDYLGVGIHNGRLQVLISLGWWDRDELSSLKTVNDGFWHTVEIQR